MSLNSASGTSWRFLSPTMRAEMAVQPMSLVAAICLSRSREPSSGNSVSFISGAAASAGLGTAIYTAGGSLTVTQRTITDNYVPSTARGRGIYNTQCNGNFSTVTLINSLVAGNRQGLSGTADLFGPFTSQGVNFIGTLDGSTPSGPGTNLSLGPLQTVADILDTNLTDNGGPTLTHLPLTGSPLIDGGSNSELPGSLTTDQRGFSRVDDGTVDIGAVEFISPAILLSITPSTGAGFINRDAEFVLTFDKTLTAGAGAIQLRRTDNNSAVPASVIISGNMVTITTSTPLPEGIGIYIEIEENALLNEAGTAFPAISNPSELAFAVCSEMVYVAPQGRFTITTDQGTLGSLDDGDTVTWTSSENSIAGLVFGVNAFTSVQSAVDAVCDEGLVHLASGDYREGSEIAISKSLTIMGDRRSWTELGRNSGAPFHRILSIAPEIDVVVDGVLITNGRLASGMGAGVLNNGNLTVRNCTFDGNVTTASGGAIANNSGASLTATNSTFARNLSSFDIGGAIDNAGGAVSLVHCTIANNTAQSDGGGISNRLGGTLNLTNSIVAGNDSINSPEILGSFTSIGANFIGTLTGSTPSGSGTNLTFASTDSSLRSLLSDLNFTNTTVIYRLVPGSPAIGAGSNEDIPAGLTTDQLDVPRILEGTVDLGAVEFSPPMTARVLSITKEGNTVNLVFSGSPGLEYLIEVSEDLDPEKWSPFEDIFMVPGSGIITFTDDEAFGDRAFYRIVGPVDGER